LLDQDIRSVSRLALMILSGCAIGLAVIVATYFVDNPKLVAGVVGGLAFAVLTIRWPEFGILVLVGLGNGVVDTDWLPSLHAGPISMQIPDLVLAYLLGLVFLRVTFRSGLRVLASPLSLPLLLFCGAILLSIANAVISFNVSANESFRTARVVTQWLAFFAVIGLVRDGRSLNRLMVGLWLLSGALLIGVIFPSFFSDLPLMSISDVALETAGRSFDGVTRIYMAGDRLLYVMIPVALASIAMAQEGGKLWRFAALGGLLFWLSRSYQRNYWLTIALSCLALLVMISAQERLRLMKRLTPALGVTLVVLAVLLTVQPGQIGRQVYASAVRLGSMLEDPSRTDSSMQWRDMENYYAVRQIAQHPLFGLGMASAYRPPLEVEAETNDFGTWSYKYMHNAYLWIAVMMGSVGLLPFLWLCAAYLLRTLRHMHEIRDERFRSAYIGFGAAFAGMLVSNWVAPHFVQSWALVIYPVMMGMNEVAYRLSKA